MNHSPRLLAFSLSLAVLMATGCNGPDNRNNAVSNSNAGTASSAAPGDAAATMDALTKSINAQLDAKSFRARLDSTFDGQEMARTIEYVAPDRFRMAGERDETVIIGSNAWTRQNGGAWQKLPIDASQMIASVRDPKMIDEIRKSAEVKLIGPDTLDGLPMMVYQYTLRNAMGTDMTSRAKAWISAADSLPRRMETETEIKGTTSKATITYFDYNTDIKIDPPK
ncbi:MAG: hypothetical protein V7641_2162 [Blastocatellia bacterium]